MDVAIPMAEILQENRMSLVAPALDIFRAAGARQGRVVLQCCHASPAAPLCRIASVNMWLS